VGPAGIPGFENALTVYFDFTGVDRSWGGVF
jgi:hypothetical protein